MKNKSFTQTRAFFWLFCIVINIVLLLGMVLSADASPRKYKGHNKQERIFQKRKAENLSEQERIYNSHPIKHFKQKRHVGRNC